MVVMKDNSWIGSYIEEHLIQKFRENQYLPELRKKYQKLTKEFAFLEKWIQQKEKELDRTLKENEVQKEELELALRKESVLNLTEIHQQVLETLFLTSQRLDLLQNLERDGTTHLFLGYFTEHFREVLQRILREKKPVTSLTLLGSLIKERETKAARILFQQGVLEISGLQHFKNEESLYSETPMVLSKEATEAIQESLKCARKQNWSRLNTEHLLFGILQNPLNQACQILKQEGIDLEGLRRMVRLVVDEEEVSPKMKKEEVEITMPKKDQDETVRVLKEIRDLLREQGRRSQDGNKRIKQEHTLFQWVVGILTFLVLILSLYVASFVFLLKSV